MRFRTFGFVILYALVAVSAFAQTGAPTGTISGHIVDSSGFVLPGVTVTAESPALQGVRSTVSTENGDYVLPFLPAGQYTLTFELQGFKTIKVQQGVSVSQTYPLNVTMDIAGVTEIVQVVGKAETISQTTTAATSVKQDLVQNLPTTRTLNAAVLFAPGVKDTGPAQNVTIQGGLSYENLFLVNGVVVNENLRGQALNLYVEDALQETTVLTSGISAEYGRFSGGVVNAITKSGGNTFSGSFRDSLTNDKWRTLTPYANDSKVDKTVPSYEYTIGGPIMKDRLWFFTDGRFRNNSNGTTVVTTATNVRFPSGSNEKRAEGKLTYSPNSTNTFRGAYTKIWQTDVNNYYTSAPIMDLRSIYTRTTPQDLLSLNYNGIVKNNFFLEGQFSQRHFTFHGSGSPWTDPINGTLLIDQQRAARFWSPTFCGVCSDELRDNANFQIKGTYFLSSAGRGSQTMVMGFDDYMDKRLANNHQSGSDYRVYTTTSIISGQTDSTGNPIIYPVINNDDTAYIQYNPIPVDSKGNDFQTISAFFNDTWQYSNHITLNLGLRWDKNHGADQTGATVVKDSAFSPRFGITYDPKGDGQWTVNANYARYVMSVANSVGDAGSGAGNPATYQWYYEGPAINTGSGPYLTPDQALPILFNWFNANGGPNTTKLPLIGADIPGVATRVNGNLTSPSVHEFAGGVTRQLGDKGALRTDVTYRKYRDFYSTRVDQSTGQVVAQPAGTYDLNLIENTNKVQRQYVGMNVQASYRVPRTSFGGVYTLSRTWGNFNGESSTGGPATAGPDFYPDYICPGSSLCNGQTWNLPVGDLSMDQRHRVRLWLNYSVPVSAAVGTIDLALLQTASSGTPYGMSGTVKSSTYVNPSINAKYVTPMGGSGVTYWFTARDAYRTAGDHRTDLALNYGHKLGAGKSQVFAQFQVLNIFDTFQLYNIAQINTTVRTRTNTSALAAFNPFTETPVEGVNFAKGPLFGQANSKDAYTTPRTFRFSVGFRF